MDSHAKRRRLEAFENLCREHGVPITPQRRVILDTALDLAGHPTADEVHAHVAGRMPGISRTTVYRTLETLVRLGVVTKASHPASSVRYDTLLETHHHLICTRCDEVTDLHDPELDRLSIPDTSALGFDVYDLSVQLRGICRRCREQEDS